MLLLEKIFFILCHFIIWPRSIFYYLILNNNEKVSIEKLNENRNKKLKDYIVDCSEKSYFYKNLDVGSIFSKYNFILSSRWNAIPIIDKNTIRSNVESFMIQEHWPKRSKWVKTGGSTGEPLKYKLSSRCESMGFAILYRGWGRGGYKLGDRLAVLAGGSLVSKNKTVKSRVLAKAMNVRKYSSYGMNDEILMGYYRDMKSWNPKFLRGYVSSIYEFARFIKEKELEISFQSIFTTAEMLLPKERELIESVFSAKVYNTYGLNDGAVSSFECKEGSMHIDIERGFLEVVNDAGESIVDSPGKIVATSFLNKATFFIRYDTGDLGVISSKPCVCGSPYPVLQDIQGRKTDALEINGFIIGSPVLTVLMSNISVSRYQFQQKDNTLTLVVEHENSKLSLEEEKFIKNSLYSQVGKIDFEILYGDEFFERTLAGKHRVVIKK